ncbi:hypothetical protein H8356DRAFT_1347539 [Neocallimastix lanati (nom. inval.)]|nr:hypothetical protein H8356DRAFT_1347539 [Neocallimastix sp. JGI-2020a]
MAPNVIYLDLRKYLNLLTLLPNHLLSQVDQLNHFVKYYENFVSDITSQTLALDVILTEYFKTFFNYKSSASSQNDYNQVVTYPDCIKYLFLLCNNLCDGNFPDEWNSVSVFSIPKKEDCFILIPTTTTITITTTATNTTITINTTTTTNITIIIQTITTTTTTITNINITIPIATITTINATITIPITTIATYNTIPIYYFINSNSITITSSTISSFTIATTINPTTITTINSTTTTQNIYNKKITTTKKILHRLEQLKRFQFLLLQEEVDLNKVDVQSTLNAIYNYYYVLEVECNFKIVSEPPIATKYNDKDNKRKNILEFNRRIIVITKKHM